MNKTIEVLNINKFFLLFKIIRFFSTIVTQQITHLTIDIHHNLKEVPVTEILSTIFGLILNLCQKLIYLNFCDFYRQCTEISILNTSINMSSTLTTLKVLVRTFDDYLYLLDGHLTSLSTLIIHVYRISDLSRTIDNARLV